MLHRRPILNARSALTICAGLAALLAVLPTRWSWWTSDLSAPVHFAALPVSWVVTKAVRAARPAMAHDANSPTVERLRLDLAELTTRNLRLAAENDQLAQQVRQLQSGLQLAGNQEVPRLIAPVFASQAGGSTLLMVRTAGLRGVDGQSTVVTPGSIAVHAGVNLVGQVIGVRGVVADIRPISDPAAGVLRATLFPLETDPAADQSSIALAAQLAPIPGPGGRGRLRGPVYVLKLPDGQTEPTITPGMQVRLTDPSWPRAAQMLVVGVVDSVEIADNGRPIIIVRPAFDVQRLEEVTILVTSEALPPTSTTNTPTPRGGAR
jgi:cell shape-determining protein MreC